MPSATLPATASQNGTSSHWASKSLAREFNRIRKLVSAGKPDRADRAAAGLLKKMPGFPPLLLLRAEASIAMQRFDTALQLADEVLGLDDGHIGAVLLKCECLSNLQGNSAALRLLQSFLESYDSVVVRRVLASRLMQDLRYAEALEVMQASLGEAEASDFELIGLCLEKLGGAAQAMNAFDIGIKVDPDYPANYTHRARMARLHENGDPRPFLLGALKADPNDETAKASFLRASLDRCDWDAFEQVIPPADDLRRVGFGSKPPSPWLFFPFADDPKSNLMRQRHRERVILGNAGMKAPERAPISQKSSDGRIRIGYFSSDFCAHATLLLMGGLLRNHDKTRFEIHCFDYGQNDALFDEHKHHFDHIHKVVGLSDAEIARLARSIGLDIAIDLKGHTQGARIGLFLLGLAPVQINYLGYPGTMGSQAYDYIIADDVVIPPEMEKHYTEKVIHLPTCYLPSDDAHAADQPPDRSLLGLPKDAVVLSCLNQPYKISRELFDLWLAALKEVPNTVLWLLDGGEEMKANLLSYTRSIGVEPDRLLFAERLPFKQHINRMAQADLYLDTFHVNAHTLAAEAICLAKVPLLTKAGKQFAARVGASFATAAGLQDLVTESNSAYYEKLVSLAKDQSALQELRQRLINNSFSNPLFSSQAYTKLLENAFAMCSERLHGGQKTRSFAVSLDGASV